MEGRLTFKKVNIGCGPNALPSWINFDVSYDVYLAKHPFVRKKVYGFLCRIGVVDESVLKSEWLEWPQFTHRLDVRNGLPFEDDSVDFIYASHSLEHVTKAEAVKILKECHRVLKPSGIIRLVVPDLKILAKKYVDNDLSFFKTEKRESLADGFLEALGLASRVEGSVVLSALYRRFGEHSRHKQLYDFDSLSCLLELCGFRKIERKGFREGEVPDIERLDNRPDESLYVEAVK